MSTRGGWVVKKGPNVVHVVFGRPHGQTFAYVRNVLMIPKCNSSQQFCQVSNKSDPASKLPFCFARSLVCSSDGANCFTLQFDRKN